MLKKYTFLFLLLMVSSLAVSAQGKEKKNKKTLEPFVAEVACASCVFDMPSPGCWLAIKIDDKTYFVDGSKLADHGDMHAEDGMCTISRHATVSGKVALGRFKAKSFELIPLEEETEE